MNNNKFKKAFTLAEVLVTLMIVGVVASLTIPSLKETADVNTYIAQCKKANSTIANVTGVLRSEKGPVRYWPEVAGTRTIEDIESGTTKAKATMAEVYATKMNVLGPAVGNVLKGADGMIWTFENPAKGCSGETFLTKRSCIMMSVDVNGEKPPNKTGADRFYFSVKANDKVYPAGAGPAGTDPKKEPAETITCSATNLDETCTAYVILKGKMDYVE